MRLDHVKVKAKDLECDCLIYLPKEKRFFWIDDIEYAEDKITLIFEEGINQRGLVTTELELKPNQQVINIINDLTLSLFKNKK